MAAETRVDPEELVRLAADVLRSSQQMSDSWMAAQGDLAIPPAAFGNSNGAAAVKDSHVTVIDEADITIGRHVAVLEGDMDRLYRVAFAYQQADREAAERQRRAGGGPRAI